MNTIPHVTWAIFGRLSLICVVVVGGAGAIQAQDDASAGRIQPLSPPITFVASDGAIDAAIEASGVATLGDGSLVLVAHDRISGLLVVERATGRVVGPPLTCGAFPPEAESAKRPKWEALARDDEGRYYVIGSHSGTPDERKARAWLLRFQILGDGTTARPYAIDNQSVRRWYIDDSVVELLRNEGLGTDRVDLRKVEGLTVRTRRDSNGKLEARELAIGLREPDDRLRVFAADIMHEPSDGAKLALKPLFSFEGGSREGVRVTLCSLEHVSALDEPGFLVLGSTEDADNHFHGNVMWFVPDSNLQSPRIVGDFERDMKVEGIDVLPSPPGAPARFVIVYDNDPNKTKTPSRIQSITIKP